MSAKRERPTEGLLGIIAPRNTGKPYTPGECNLLFFLAVRGIPFDVIARLMNRKDVSSIEREWKRICTNATDYEGKREYQLTPLCQGEISHLNTCAQYYTWVQYASYGASPETIAKRIGCNVELVRNYLIIRITDRIEKPLAVPDSVISKKGKRRLEREEAERHCKEPSQDDLKRVRIWNKVTIERLEKTIEETQQELNQVKKQIGEINARRKK